MEARSYQPYGRESKINPLLSKRDMVDNLVMIMFATRGRCWPWTSCSIGSHRLARRGLRICPSRAGRLLGNVCALDLVSKERCETALLFQTLEAYPASCTTDDYATITSYSATTQPLSSYINPPPACRKCGRSTRRLDRNCSPSPRPTRTTDASTAALLHRNG